MRIPWKLWYSSCMADFKVFTYELHTAKLTAGPEGPVFVMLADLHNHSYGPDNCRLLERIREIGPDAILIAGDMLVASRRAGGAESDAALRLLQALRREGYPVFYGNGNHESRLRLHPEIYGDSYGPYARELEAWGIPVLNNECIAFEAKGLRLHIYGFELAEAYYRKFERRQLPREELTRALGDPDPTCYNLLLAHNPVHFDAYAAWGADLTLSGHLHGGIIRIPGLGGVITPQARLFPRYDAGHFQKNGRDLVVSRGLGTHTVNIRIFNPPELSVIRLKGE